MEISHSNATYLNSGICQGVKENKNPLFLFFTQIYNKFNDNNKRNLTTLKKDPIFKDFEKHMSQKALLYPKAEGDYVDWSEFKAYYDSNVLSRQKLEIMERHLDPESNTCGDKNLMDNSFLLPIIRTGETYLLNDVLPSKLYEHVTSNAMLRIMSRNYIGFANPEMNRQSTEVLIRFALNPNKFKIDHCGHCRTFILEENDGHLQCSTCQMKICSNCFQDFPFESCNRFSFKRFIEQKMDSKRKK